MTGYRRLISYIYAYEGEEKGKNIAVINIYYLYISNDMYVIIKIHLWHNRDQYAFCLKKIKGIDILEDAQRLGLPVTSYKKSIVQLECINGRTLLT